MAYDIVVDGNEFDLASIQGFKNVRKWVENNGTPFLRELFENNETDDVQEVRKEIILILSSGRFVPKNIRTTLDYMATVSMKVGKVAYISDGFTNDE